MHWSRCGIAGALLRSERTGSIPGCRQCSTQGPPSPPQGGVALRHGRCARGASSRRPRRSGAAPALCRRSPSTPFLGAGRRWFSPGSQPSALASRLLPRQARPVPADLVGLCLNCLGLGATTLVPCAGFGRVASTAGARGTTLASRDCPQAPFVGGGKRGHSPVRPAGRHHGAPRRRSSPARSRDDLQILCPRARPPLVAHPLCCVVAPLRARCWRPPV